MCGWGHILESLLQGYCLEVISYSYLLSTFCSSRLSSRPSSVWNSFPPFFTGDFSWLFTLLLEDALLLQEALLTALCPLQAGWVDTPPLPPCPGIFAPVFDPALDLFPSLLPASLGLQGQNSA